MKIEKFKYWTQLKKELLIVSRQFIQEEITEHEAVERLLVNKNGVFAEQRVDPFMHGVNLINVYPKEVKIFKEEK